MQSVSVILLTAVCLSPRFAAHLVAADCPSHRTGISVSMALLCVWKQRWSVCLVRFIVLIVLIWERGIGWTGSVKFVRDEVRISDCSYAEAWCWGLKTCCRVSKKSGKQFCLTLSFVFLFPTVWGVSSKFRVIPSRTSVTQKSKFRF